MQKLLIITLLSIFLFACGNEKTNENISVIDEGTDIVKEEPSSNTAFDWAGSYFGTLPCASCPGINTIITLNNDGTYEETIEYIENENHMYNNGTFNWNNEKSIINIEGLEYKVADDKLILLDSKGNENTSELKDKYILKKYGYSKIASNKDFKKSSFVDENGNEYEIFINKSLETPLAMIHDGDKTELLFLQKAWNNNNEYISGKMRFNDSPDEKQLIIGDEIIQLSTK